MAEIAVGPVGFVSHQPHIRLMDEGRRLERLPRLLLGQPGRGQFAQLVVDQRQKLLSGRRIALFDLRENAGDIRHVDQDTSQVPGWVGVRCESEEMPIWLMRAIIVENIMVRREGDVLYLPAGPRFTLKREIKNIITAIAKTVHYLSAHLPARQPPKHTLARIAATGCFNGTFYASGAGQFGPG